MNDELKPCPFCGGEANLRPTFDVVGWTTDDEAVEVRSYVYECNNPECPAIVQTNTCPTEKEAAFAWNTRIAATDEQFSMAMHDGEAWVKNRTCRDVGDSEQFFRCNQCGCEVMLHEAVGDSTWNALYCGELRFCPNCGAEVQE